MRYWRTFLLVLITISMGLMFGFSQNPVQANERSSLQANCISLSQIRETIIEDDQTIIFRLSGKRSKRVTLAFPCPSLKFYGSFGYEAYSNRLCARTDTIVSRAGTHCPIAEITSLPDAH